MRFQRIKAVAVAAAMVGTLAACGGGESEPEVYQPASYGNDDTEQCYYIEDPEEVRLLKEDGLCEQDWVATPAPEDYVASYFPFFFFVGSFDGDRHHYSKRYVPKSKHGAYSSRLTTLNSNPAFKSKVATLSPNAVYKSNTGKTVKGSQVKSNSFGNSRTAGGSGSRPKGCAAGVTLDGAEITLVKGGSSGGGGSRSSGGGGSKSSGGSKSGGSSKSGTKSGTTAKC